MLFYGIMIGIGVIFLIVFTLLLVNGYKLKSLSIKLEEAEKDASEILKDKYNLLVSIDSIMKSKDKEDLFKGLESIDIEKLDNFELNKELSRFDKTVVELTDYNKEIVFDDNEEEVFENLYTKEQLKEDIDSTIIGMYSNGKTEMNAKSIIISLLRSALLTSRT